MSKADVIEIEGTVVEKLPNAMFQVELENGSSGSGSHQWKIKNELHKDLTGGQSNIRVIPI